MISGSRVGFAAVAAVLAMAAVMPQDAHAESPLAQFKSGVPLAEIMCSDGKVLLESPRGTPACAKESSVPQMEQRGFVKIAQSMDAMDMMEPKDAMEPKDMMEPEAMTSGLTGEIEIAALLPLTGDLSSHGEENYAGTEFGVIKFNEHLKEIGEEWQFKLVQEDTATQPTIALEKLQAINARDIKVVIGPETSGNTKHVKGYADSNGMLLLSCCSTAPALAIPNDSVYRLIPDDTNQGPALAAIMMELGIEAVVPIYRNDPYGTGLYEKTRDAFVAAGGTMDEGQAYNQEITEFSASASLLAETVQGYVDEVGADKVAVLYVGFKEIETLAQASSGHEILDQVRWFGPDGATKQVGLVTDPIASEFAESVQFISTHVAADRNPLYKSVEGYVLDKLGRSPTTFAHSSYDAVWLVGLSMLETGSTEVEDIKSVIHEVTAGFEGALGGVMLNEAGDLDGGDYEMWGTRGGEWVLLGTYLQADNSVNFVDGESMMEAADVSGEIRIGMLTDTSGDFAPYGVENAAAAALAVTNFNKHLAESGEEWSISLEQVDTAGDPEKGLEAVKRFDSEGIGIISGPETSAITTHIKGYTEENDMTVFSCCSTAPALAISGDRVFRLIPDDTNQGGVFNDIFEHEGISAIVPMWRGDVWGDGLHTSVEEAFEGTMDEGIRYEVGTEDYASYIEDLAGRVTAMSGEHGMENVAVLYIGFDEVHQVMAAATAHEILGDVRWFGSDSNARDPEIVKEVPEFLESAGFTTISPAAAEGAAFDAVNAHVMGELGREPRTFAHATYDTIWIIGLAIQEAGADAKAVAAALPGVAEDYMGAIGETNLNAAGDLAEANYDIWGVTGGVWERLGSYTHADDTVVFFEDIT